MLKHKLGRKKLSQLNSSHSTAKHPIMWTNAFHQKNLNDPCQSFTYRYGTHASCWSVRYGISPYRSVPTIKNSKKNPIQRLKKKKIRPNQTKSGYTVPNHIRTDRTEKSIEIIPVSCWSSLITLYQPVQSSTVNNDMKDKLVTSSNIHCRYIQKRVPLAMRLYLNHWKKKQT